MINATALINLGRDAEVRQTSAGPVMSFSGASTTKKGQEEVTTWVRCSMFGKRGEALAKHLTKGSKVMVSGSLTQREYEDKNGNARTSLEMNVSELAFAGGKRDGESRGGQHSSTTGGGRNADDESDFGGGGSHGYDDGDYGLGNDGSDDDIPF
jgi:single-strand DNA-binding protein